MKIFNAIICGLMFLPTFYACSGQQNKQGAKANVSNSKTIESWLTGNGHFLEKQGEIIFFKEANSNPVIKVDSTIKFQTIDGFGYTLTGGSAMLINKLPDAQKSALLEELFSSTAQRGIKVSYLRLTIGASDLDAEVFSYDDIPDGATDEALAYFDMGHDRQDLIPLLKKIVAINPSMQFIATPWSAPIWMKDNHQSKGGSLKRDYCDVYAKYFVKYIQAMQKEGINITAITPQNEPLHPGNNPSMYMPAAEQAIFIKNSLGPAFKNAGIKTKIIVYDHNCNKPEYPLAILDDPEAKKYVDGSAFHLYEGDISALTRVHEKYPQKNLYFTEQYTASDGQFNGDLNWHIKNVVIGSMRNWSRTAMEWNLANDPNFEPHTPGGCNTCKGALTIGDSITRNVAYYIIAHASAFVAPGSIRIASNEITGINNVAFLTPSGKKVLIAENESNSAITFIISFNNQSATATLNAGEVKTFMW